MDSVTDSLVHLTRNLIDIDSTSGRELEATTWLATWLRERNYHVVEQPVADSRVNIIATIDTNFPEIVFSTHIDCVPPFFPSRMENDLLYGRGACDAKGILAAELTALELLRARGESRVGLLVVVGEENGSHGARAANSFKQGCRYLINGEPTNNRLGSATRGVYRVRLASAGLAAHSSNPELGNSAIEKLIDALVELREVNLPSDKILGRTSYTVGMISGGVAPNVVPPSAEADVNFRTVGAAPEVRSCLRPLVDKVSIEDLMIVPPVQLITFPEFETEVFRFTTDIPFLTAWGQPLLIGPGSVKVAHTDTEHVAIPELVQAVDLYQRLALRLLT
jgi:acetylornithine deacetylase